MRTELVVLSAGIWCLYYLIQQLRHGKKLYQLLKPNNSFLIKAQQSPSPKP
jgi:hypothetical protein